MTILRHLAADLARDHSVTVASFDGPADAPGIVQLQLQRPPATGRTWRLAPIQRAAFLARSVPPRLVQDADMVVALDCHFARLLRRYPPRRLVYLSLSCIPRQEWAGTAGVQRVLAAAQFAWLERCIAKAAHAVVTASHQHASDLRHYAGMTRPPVVLYPVFPHAAPAQSGVAGSLRAGLSTAGPVTILSAGRLVPGKNMHAVIDLAHRLRDLPCRWIIAGDGPEHAELLAQVAAAGLAGRIELPGAVADLPALLAQCDIFLHPSRYESFGIAVFEAMRAGLPVLCARAAGCAEVMQDGVAGHVVDFATPGAVADRLRALILDPAHRAQMGSAGKSAATRLLAQDYCSGFRQVLGRPALELQARGPK